MSEPYDPYAPIDRSNKFEAIGQALEKINITLDKILKELRKK